MMRNILLTVAALVIPSAAAHATTATIVNGNGAFVAFEHVSDDGVLAVATQIDTCDPDDFGNGFGGTAALPHAASGLASAQTAGTVVLDGFNGGQLALEIDLAWTGTGAVSTQRSRFRGENTFDFQVSQSRDAVLTGVIEVDGEAADLSGALLFRGVAGSILR